MKKGNQRENKKRNVRAEILLEFLKDPLFMVALGTAIVNTIALICKIVR